MNYTKILTTNWKLVKFNRIFEQNSLKIWTQKNLKNVLTMKIFFMNIIRKRMTVLMIFISRTLIKLA